MKNNYIENINKSIIELDIKALYRWKIKSLIPATLFIYAGMLLFWSYCNLSSTNSQIGMNIILTIYITYALSVTVYLIYIIKQYHQKNMQYSIISDTRINFDNKRMFSHLLFGEGCMRFSRGGKFYLDVHRTYYQWSNLYPMDADNFRNSSISGDRFYLVIKNNKILNVYNQKFFIMDDE